jgi:hypothetical protein
MYFDAVGDQQPNHAEIHLDSTDIKIAHSEYYQVLNDAGEAVLGYRSFLNMWDTCFPHVKSVNTRRLQESAGLVPC